MSAQEIVTRFYVQTDPGSDTWLDVTADVLQRDSRWTKGILSSHPLERVASVGTFTFLLRNDAQSGVENRWTPGHMNCTPGFQVRCKVEIRSTWEEIEKTQWVGWIPPNGIQQIRNGSRARFAQVMAFDWMYFVLNSPVTLAEIGIDKNLGEIGTALAGLLTAQPSRIDTTSYVEMFENTNDTVRENTTIYIEMDKAAKSELGYCFIKYEPRTGAKDILMLEGRRYRDSVSRFDAVPLPIGQSPGLLTENGNYYLTTEEDEPIAADSIDPFDSLPEVMDYKVVNGAHYANRWLGKTYPRKVGAPAVIFVLNEALKLAAGESRENLRVRYFVADGYTAVSAQNVSITDYEMNAQADGGGADLTADLDIDGEFGSADAVISIENTSDQEAWVTTIELSGDPIYIGDTVTQVVEIPDDDASLYGQIEYTLDQKYQSDPMRTLDQTTLLAVRYSQRRNTVEEISFCADLNAVLTSVYMLTDIGARIPLVVEGYGINEDYFVQGIETWQESLMTFCRFYLKPARYETYKFWKLGVPGSSELGATAVLGIEQ